MKKKCNIRIERGDELNIDINIIVHLSSYEFLEFDKGDLRDFLEDQLKTYLGEHCI